MDRTQHILVGMCGLPRSGKSTWARAQNYPIVSPDAIRLAMHGQRYVQEAEQFVWAVARCMVRALFLAGHATIILDATNYSRKRRDEWVCGDWTTCWQVIHTPREVCLERARAEGDAEIVPVIERMAAGWEPPGDDELKWMDPSKY